MSTPVPPRGSKCVTYIAQNGLTLRSSSLYDEARDWIVWTGGFSIAQEADGTLRFVTADGRTIPRSGYRCEDFVDDEIGVDAQNTSAEGFCTTTVQGEFERDEIRETEHSPLCWPLSIISHQISLRLSTLNAEGALTGIPRKFVVENVIERDSKYRLGVPPGVERHKHAQTTTWWLLPTSPSPAPVKSSKSATRITLSSSATVTSPCRDYTPYCQCLVSKFLDLHIVSECLIFAPCCTPSIDSPGSQPLVIPPCCRHAYSFTDGAKWTD